MNVQRTETLCEKLWSAQIATMPDDRGLGWLVRDILGQSMSLPESTLGPWTPLLLSQDFTNLKLDVEEVQILLGFVLQFADIIVFLCFKSIATLSEVWELRLFVETGAFLHVNSNCNMRAELGNEIFFFLRKCKNWLLFWAEPPHSPWLCHWEVCHPHLWMLPFLVNNPSLDTRIISFSLSAPTSLLGVTLRLPPAAACQVLALLISEAKSTGLLPLLPR